MIVLNEQAVITNNVVVCQTMRDLRMKQKYMADRTAFITESVFGEAVLAHGKMERVRGMTVGVVIGTSMWFAVDAVILICRKMGVF